MCLVFSDVVWALPTFVCHDIYPGHLLHHFVNFEKQVVQQYWEAVPLLIAEEKAARNLPGKFSRLKNFRIPAILQKKPQKHQITQPNFEKQ